VGGKIILFKKGIKQEEFAQGMNAAHQIGAILHAYVGVNLPGLEDDRWLIVWEQQKPCPAQFPRSGAAIAKRRLGQ
jgi:16S rRNA (guanine527-N7)-methyltransferase